MKTWTLPVAFALLTVLNIGCNSKKETDGKEIAEEQNEQKFENSLMEEDAAFVLTAAEGGMMEVMLGDIAQTQGRSEKVKEFGQQMVIDHTAANNELKELSIKKNITISQQLGKEKQDRYNEIAAKKGAEFDKAYMKFMVKDHKEDIEAFKKQTQNGKDGELVVWARQKLPVLEHHLHMAEDLNKSVDK